ncbi:hypothetical protein GCM10007147_40000 [Nocardiopsis kunsanensis]|uniref:Uncharacterized protein n=1 Tax=Nocardiopsis kunsanensis TaxID=141693 RepID=A0A918XJ07_9ACTN|nr:hypothetical protein GCM10007147_40000 [Nocardiopsis kunsanensis]
MHADPKASTTWSTCLASAESTSIRSPVIEHNGHDLTSAFSRIHSDTAHATASVCVRWFHLHGPRTGSASDDYGRTRTFADAPSVRWGRIKS